MEIDPEGPVAVYRQVAGIIRARIESGELAPHRRIPTEKDLVDLYGIARTTARRAIALLREEGLIYTVPQRGSYVAERPAGSRTGRSTPRAAVRQPSPRRGRSRE